MAMINPNEGGGSRRASKGRKVLAAVGLDYGKSQAGNAKVDVHWIVMRDLDAPKGQPGEQGCSHWDTFTLTDKTRWRLGACAKALGCTTPFDDEDESAVRDILTGGYCVGTIVDKPRFNGQPGEMTTETRYFDAYDGAEDDDWPEMIAKAEDAHTEMRERQAAKVASGGGGYSRPAAGASQQQRAAQRPSDDPAQGDGIGGSIVDDDIPFKEAVPA